MQHDRLDDRIRAKLKDYPTLVDTDKLRHNIEAKRYAAAAKQEKKRRWVLLLSCLMGLAGMWLLLQIHFFDKQTASTTTIAPQNETVASMKPKSETGSNLLENKPNSPPTSEPSSQASAISLPNNEPTPPIAETDAPLSENHTPETIQASELPTHFGENQTTKSHMAHSIKKENTTPANPPTDLHLTTTEAAEHPKAVQKRQLLPIWLPASKTIHLQADIKTNGLPPPLLTASGKKRVSYASIYFASGWAIKKLQGSSSAYIARRNQTEMSLGNWSVGALYHLQFPSGFELSAGLSYQKMTEKFLWERQSSEIIKEGDQFFQQYSYRVKTTYNRFEYIDLPLLLGYQKKRARWSYGVRAGAYINLSQKLSGEILTPDLEPGQFTGLDETNFKNRIAPAIAADVIFGYRLSPGIQITFQPGVKFQTGSITTADFEAEQRYTFLHAKLGLQWQK